MTLELSAFAGTILNPYLIQWLSIFLLVQLKICEKREKVKKSS